MALPLPSIAIAIAVQGHRRRRRRKNRGRLPLLTERSPVPTAASLCSFAAAPPPLLLLLYSALLPSLSCHDRFCSQNRHVWRGMARTLFLPVLCICMYRSEPTACCHVGTKYCSYAFLVWVRREHKLLSEIYNPGQELLYCFCERCIWRIFLILSPYLSLTPPHTSSSYLSVSPPSS